MLERLCYFCCQRNSWRLLHFKLTVYGSRLGSCWIYNFCSVERSLSIGIRLGADGADYLLVGADWWSSFWSIKYSMFSLYFAIIIGVSWLSLRVDWWIIVLKVVGNSWIALGYFLFACNLILSDFYHFFRLGLFILQLNLKMMDPVDILFLLNIELVHSAQHSLLHFTDFVYHLCFRLSMLSVDLFNLSFIVFFNLFQGDAVVLFYFCNTQLIILFGYFCL